ncbi:MAG: AAA family ATPase, partial [Phycisphaeraceae bacterium]
EDEFTMSELQAVYEAVLDALKRHEIDVLIVDPFVSSHKVDENANFKIDAIAKQWGRVAAEARCAVVLVHHSRKPAGQKVDTEAARGASALVNATRSVLVLNRLTADEAKSFSIEGDDQRRRYFSVADDKHNRAPPEKADWYRIVSVPLGNGTADRLGGREDGDEVGAVERWTPPDPCEGISDADLRLVQDAVAKGEWRESVQANAWVGRTAARVLGLDADDPADRRRLKMLIKKWLANGVLRIERRKDGSRQERSFVVPGAPVA